MKGFRFGSAGRHAMTDDRDHDEELAIRMLCGEEEALREVLEKYLEPVRELLIGTYGTTVQRPEIDEAVNLAIHRMWKKAHRYDKTQASLGGWFFTIAQRAVIDIFRRERRYRRRYALMDPEYDQEVDCSDEEEDQVETFTKEEKQEYADLKYVVEHKLKGNQKIIVLADLAAGGT